MKKILVLLSMFALASGAWAADANYGYSWTIEINNLPEDYNTVQGFPLSDLTAYLVDTREQEGESRYRVIAYVSVKDLQWAFDGNKITGADINSKTAYGTRNTLPRATDLFYMDNTMAIDGLTMSVSSDSHAVDKEKDLFVCSYKSSLNLIDYYNASSQGGGYDPVLKTVLFSEERGLYQVLDVNWAKESAFQSSAAFAPVPEPTSGLLLLLGVAGLALKRKKAA